ncbi:hypothetical protein [Pedobacter borealis]
MEGKTSLQWRHFGYYVLIWAILPAVYELLVWRWIS